MALAPSMDLTRGGTAGCTCSTTSSSSGPTRPSCVTRNAAAFLVYLLPSAANNIFIVSPGPLSPQHQHRDAAVGENVLRFAAEQDALEAFAAVRSHDDQVALVLLRRRHDRFSDQVGLRNQGLGLDAF